MAKENKKLCHQCWEYQNYCKNCNLGWCDWLAESKAPHVATDCEAFNSKLERRKHRDENAEILERVKEFYDFLQGISVPKNFVISKRQRPKLTPDKAFSVIYMMQEHLFVLPDSFEQCQACKGLYDSDSEGCSLDDQYELDGKTLPKKYWKRYCGDCVPNIEYSLK